jgi:hypothetical protein
MKRILPRSMDLIFGGKALFDPLEVMDQTDDRLVNGMIPRYGTDSVPGEAQ